MYDDDHDVGDDHYDEYIYGHYDHVHEHDGDHVVVMIGCDHGDVDDNNDDDHDIILVCQNPILYFGLALPPQPVQKLDFVLISERFPQYTFSSSVINLVTL